MCLCEIQIYKNISLYFDVVVKTSETGHIIHKSDVDTCIYVNKNLACNPKITNILRICTCKKRRK